MQSADPKNHAELESRIPGNRYVRFGGGSQKPGLATGEGAGSHPTSLPLRPRKDGSRLSAIQDLFSRAIVGWSMKTCQDEQLVEDALVMALQRRNPPEGLLHHSDRGCQYTSERYLTLLHLHGIQVSMSRKGNCYDNAVMERFFGSLKWEAFPEPDSLFPQQQCRCLVFEYIEIYYNRVRLHSALGYLSPMAFEQLRSSAQLLSSTKPGQ